MCVLHLMEKEIREIHLMIGKKLVCLLLLATVT